MEGCLPCGESGGRHAEWSGADIVEADVMAETDGVGIASVFSADPDLQVRPHSSAPLDSQTDEGTDPVLVDRLEWIPREDTVLSVVADEVTVVVTAHAEACLRQVVSREGEELRLLGDL